MQKDNQMIINVTSDAVQSKISYERHSNTLNTTKLMRQHPAHTRIPGKRHKFARYLRPFGIRLIYRTFAGEIRGRCISPRIISGALPVPSSEYLSVAHLLKSHPNKNRFLTKITS